MNRIESCITPGGTFKYGIHKPSFSVKNLRGKTKTDTLGLDNDGQYVDNTINYPQSDLVIAETDWIYEVPNPLPFRGRTYINKRWADASAENIGNIKIPEPPQVSLSNCLKQSKAGSELFRSLPVPLLLALATTSTDPEDLRRLAEISCEFTSRDDGGLGLRYHKDPSGRMRAVIHDFELFEAVANNPFLPGAYKIAMVIRPGAQGASEIVGEYRAADHTHVFEYLRRNSYISGGHYAANMADDAIRYSIDDLSEQDFHGLRHLYYQRTYVRLATQLGITAGIEQQRTLNAAELEELRLSIIGALAGCSDRVATLWGWNFGFDYAPTRYRLHASHQQIHQQYAIIPDRIEAFTSGTKDSCGTISAYSCGDLVTQVIEEYRQQYQSDFFTDYLQAIRTNRRMDDHPDKEASLVIYSDDNVMVFVPKAQTSQWEIQLMTLPRKDGNAPGNLIECDADTRYSVDQGILNAQRALASLGAKMVTTIEYSKRIGKTPVLNQPLMYGLMPRLPESPGAFSEAQLRFINGHYPEDFALALRNCL
ncbi:hypothetical protein [Desulforhopalus singaporensis]|uniref:Uncharacterized protein n=1 Tax=Desulforhopalus singaporensis TaxID=91360 RepID=A0A1H0NWP2_9BACT|nr:hypothetical protein [Desulforhopalus singaporensis]SDO96845.1 hypothetical protein SAMN05660330_01470 [Desulforhopalus singaporensis]